MRKRNKAKHRQKRRERNIKYHAQTRLHERFSDLTVDDLDAMVKIIQTGGAKFLKKQSNRVSVFNIIYGEYDMTVVYDKMRKLIVTVY